MKLSGLDPHWIGLQNWSLPDRPLHIGVSFLCPHCDPSLPEHGPDRRRRLAVLFYPHIDPTGVMAEFGISILDNSTHHRRVSGETFDTLSLAPSVGFDSIGHWHGCITNGECAP